MVPRYQSAYRKLHSTETALCKIPYLIPLNIQPVVVVRGLKRQQDAALTNFVGCFFFLVSHFFFTFSAIRDF